MFSGKLIKLSHLRINLRKADKCLGRRGPVDQKQVQRGSHCQEPPQGAHPVVPVLSEIQGGCGLLISTAPGGDC